MLAAVYISSLVLVWTQTTNLFGNCFVFHAYNETTQRRSKTDPKCPKFEDATKPYSDETIEKLRLWPELMSQFDKENGQSLYGSELALHAIWKNQNPENCSEAKFLISGGWPYGFGSRIHMEGSALGLAMHLNRIYLPHPDGDNFFWETNNNFCRNGTRWEPGMNCYWQSYSKCAKKEFMYPPGKDVNHIPNIEGGSFKDTFNDQDVWNKKMDEINGIKAFNVIYITGRIPYDNKLYIPHQLQQVINCSPMKPEAYYYWWRAVSATFIARPHDLVMAKMHTLMTDLKIAEPSDYNACIAMHVRHGDKGIEMELLPFERYRQVAQHIHDSGFTPASHDEANPRAKNGSFFITSEDPDVFSEADQWGKENNWEIVYTDLVNRDHLTAKLTWDEQRHQKKAEHDDLEYLSYIMNLHFSLKCEAYVCTMPSNSCRIMDELRATVGGKANRIYADLSKSTCGKPPCLDGTYAKNWGD